MIMEFEDHVPQPEAQEQKYVLYNFDMNELVTTTVYSTHEEASEALDNRLDNVIIVELKL